MNMLNVVKTTRKNPQPNPNAGSEKPAHQALTLYELSQDYRQALSELTDPELDLPAEVITDTLEGLQGSLEDKTINIAKFFPNLEAVTEPPRKSWRLFGLGYTSWAARLAKSR